MSWRSELIEHGEWTKLAAQPVESSARILELQRMMIAMRRDNNDYFSVNKGEPEILVRRRNAIEASLRQRWGAPGATGVPTNIPATKLAVDMACDIDAEYARLKQECLDLKANYDELDAQIEDEKRHHQACMQAWQMNVVFIYPDAGEAV